MITSDHDIISINLRFFVCENCKKRVNLNVHTPNKCHQPYVTEPMSWRKKSWFKNQVLTLDLHLMDGGEGWDGKEIFNTSSSLSKNCEKIDFTWFLSLKLSQLKFIYTHITVWPLSQLISLGYWSIKFHDETITKTHLKRYLSTWVVPEWFHTTCNAEKLLKIMSTSQTIEEKSSTNLWYFRLDLEVMFSDLLPETKTQDGMRANSNEGCRPSFVKSNNSFGFENLEGTVIHSRVNLTNSTSVNGLVV